MNKKPGLLLVVSGPSGAGKSTTLHMLMRQRDDMCFSVSATTRQPRMGEMEGVHYCFISPERFQEMRQQGELLEHAEYAGNYYGTPAGPVKQAVKDGQIAVLDIEALGAMQVREHMPGCILAFLCPSSLAEVERRLRGRKTESEERIRQRMAAAAEQYSYIPQYDYLINNDSLEGAVDALRCVIEAERCKVNRQSELPKAAADI